MWTASSGHSRALVSFATAGAIALTAGGFTAMPAAMPAVPAPPAAVFTPVDLTALSADSSLMDIIGSLTGLNFIIPFLNSPDTPLFPFVTAFETLGQALFVIPVTVAIGAPLLLITEGFEGVQDLFTELGGIFGVVQDAFDNIMDWYATRNWFTGALLDPAPGAAVDLTGLAGLSGWDEVLPADGIDGVLAVDGFDAVPADVDLDLGDLIA